METTNEILVNEEAVDVIEEVIKNDSGKVLKTLGIIGGVVGVVALGYTLIAKPLIKKKRAKKEEEGHDIHVLDEDEYEEFDPDDSED